MKKFLRYLFIGVLFPLMVLFVFYFQFTSNYTQDLFSEQGFTRFYNSNVYQTRFLGRELHLWVYHRIASTEKMIRYKSNPYNSRRLLHLDQQADPVFYLTYFFIAVFFTILTALLLMKILSLDLFHSMDSALKDVSVCFFTLLIGFTQFVVTPYDTIGYFFEALGLLFFLQYIQTGRKIFYAVLVLTIMIATFNRETSLLILSFMAALYYTSFGIKMHWIRKMILPVLFFALPYLFLKLYTGNGAHFTDKSQLSVNLNLRDPYSMMGFLFAAFIIYFVYRINRNRPALITSFFFFSLPYVIIIFVVGLTQEYRLWIPLLQGALILSFLDMRMVTPGQRTAESDLMKQRMS